MAADGAGPIRGASPGRPFGGHETAGPRLRGSSLGIAGGQHWATAGASFRL